jgi:cell envelope opacity-associated protein A
VKAYAVDENGYYLGEVERQPSPLEPGVFLLPRMTVEAAPPSPAVDQEAQFISGKWQLVKSRASVRAEEEAAARAAEEAERIRREQEEQARKAKLEPAINALKSLKAGDIKNLAQAEAVLLHVRDLLGLK